MRVRRQSPPTGASKPFGIRAQGGTRSASSHRPSAPTDWESPVHVCGPFCCLKSTYGGGFSPLSWPHLRFTAPGLADPGTPTSRTDLPHYRLASISGRRRTRRVALPGHLRLVPLALLSSSARPVCSMMVVDRVEGGAHRGLNSSRTADPGGTGLPACLANWPVCTRSNRYR